jgi:hypothetical protein
MLTHSGSAPVGRQRYNKESSCQNKLASQSEVDSKEHLVSHIVYRRVAVLALNVGCIGWAREISRPIDYRCDAGSGRSSVARVSGRRIRRISRDSPLYTDWADQGWNDWLSIRYNITSHTAIRAVLYTESGHKHDK